MRTRKVAVNLSGALRAPSLRSLLSARTVLALCILPWAICGCGGSRIKTPQEDEAEFTFWVLRQVAASDQPEVRVLLEAYKGIEEKTLSLRAEAAGGRVDRERLSEALSSVAEKKQRIVAQVREFLRTCPETRRVTFSVGPRSPKPQRAVETFKAFVGSRSFVLLEVRNRTELSLTVSLSGSSSGGFYVWPREVTLPGGESRFSLLAVCPLAAGLRKGFIAVEAASPSGKRTRLEMALQGDFLPAKETPHAVPADFVPLRIRSTYQGAATPALLSCVVPEGTDKPVVLSQVPAEVGAHGVKVWSTGEVRLCVPRGTCLLRARRGPCLSAEKKLTVARAALTVELQLTWTGDPWLRQWTAGILYPPLPEAEDLSSVLKQLSAEGVAVGHLWTEPAQGAFGRYPVTLTETFRPGPCVITKAGTYAHTAWGGLLELSVLLGPTCGLWGDLRSDRGDWPDLIAVCDQVSAVGGKAVGFAFGEGPGANLQLPLAGVLGKLDALVLSPQTLTLWYDLLNCGFRLAPAGLVAGAKSRCLTFVRLPTSFTYDRYLRHLCRGEVFVTCGPLLRLRVNGKEPGSEIRLSGKATLTVEASGRYEGRPVPVEVIVNGKVHTRGEQLSFSLPARQSSWIALRAGKAHTAPVYVRGEGPVMVRESALRLKKRLEELLSYAQSQAFFLSQEQKISVLNHVQRGLSVLEEILTAPLRRDPWVRQRHLMVEAQLRRRNIRDEGVLRAMAKVPRHLFVPETHRAESYIDSPLPIGYGQTISQPYIVAFMTEALRLTGTEKVLEIGTGSGYQAAILAELAREVYTIEIVKPLKERAERVLRSLNYRNVHVRWGDGYRGWPEEAPFDAIIVTAAPDHVPRPLIDQLAPGGRMVIPVGVYSHTLQLIEKKEDRSVTSKPLLPVYFVPMTGEAQKKRTRGAR